MYTTFGNSNAELCKEMGKIDIPKIAQNWLLEKNVSVFRLTYLEEYFTDQRNRGVKIYVYTYPFRMEKHFCN